MVMSCVACRLHGDEGGAFFRLPKNQITRKIWVERLELSDWFLTTEKVYRVCFRHFHQEQFKTGGKYITLVKGMISNFLQTNHSVRFLDFQVFQNLYKLLPNILCQFLYQKINQISKWNENIKILHCRTTALYLFLQILLLYYDLNCRAQWCKINMIEFFIKCCPSKI